MGYDFEIYDKGLELVLKIYVDKEDTPLDVTRKNPNMADAYKEFFKKLNERGWYDGEKPIINTDEYAKLRQLPDKSYIFKHHLTVESHSKLIQ